MTLEDALREVDTIVDALGMPVDTHIRRIVAALHMHAIPTYASCEGHFDEGESYPWVGIGEEADMPAHSQEVDNPKVRELGQRLQGLTKEFKNVELYAVTLMTDVDVRYHISATTTELSYRRLDGDTDEEKLQLANGVHLIKLLRLLDDFYGSDRRVPFGNRLMLEPGGVWGDAILSNNAASVQSISKNTEKTKQLHAFRKEMNDFADYLIDVVAAE